MINPFLAALILIFFAEIVGSTEIVIFSLAVSHKAFFAVFSGALLAHIVMDGVAVVIGASLAKFIHPQFIAYVVGIFFISIGILEFLKKGKGKKYKANHAFFKTLGLVALAEIGDRTLFASGLLAAEYQVMLPVFLGAVLGLALAIGLNVLVGTLITRKIPYKAMTFVSGLLFVIFGILSIIQAL